MGLYIYIGAKRNGKTISVINEGENFYKEGYTIYSNISLSYPHIDLKRKDILEWEKKDLNLPAKCIFIIDEIHSWFDSRNSMNSNNKVFSYFMSQLGHFTSDKQRGLTILGTTQKFSFMDIRGRQLTDKIIECIKVEEKENEYVKILRIYKINRNDVLKTYKREFVLFDKSDFDKYDTQQQMKSETQ